MTPAEACAVLGVPVGAHPAAARKAYRKLAFQHHPDRNPDNPGAAETFRRVVDAWDVLRAGGPRPPRTAPAPKGKRNTRLDITFTLRLSLVQHLYGGRVHTPLPASAADRKRRPRGSLIVRCAACGGAAPRTCVCRGVGYSPHMVPGWVDLPAGLTPGVRIRIPGRGLPGSVGSAHEPDGDLVIIIEVPDLTAAGYVAPSLRVVDCTLDPDDDIVATGEDGDEPEGGPRLLSG